MAILLHVLIALSSIVYTGYVYLNPTKSRFYTSYILVGITLATGTGLVLAAPSHMMSACMTGIVYLGFITLGLVFAHRKLARSENRSNF